MDTIIHDGKKLTRSRTLGWRPAAEGDVDADGNPVGSSYVVLVKIADCPVVEKDGGVFYDTAGVPQSVKLGYGGTYYGYETKTSTTRSDRVFSDVRGASFTVRAGGSYAKVTMFVVMRGKVYTASWFRALS